MTILIRPATMQDLDVLTRLFRAVAADGEAFMHRPADVTPDGITHTWLTHPTRS
ncbi:MAG: hypothetical protein ACLFTK_13350 [Anaerolineales bacterium]